MISGAQQTLFLPFETDILDNAQSGSHWLACGLAADLGLPDDWKKALLCLQPFRPDYLMLEKAGFTAVARVDESLSFDGGLLLLGKHRGRNEVWFAQLLRQVKPGGRIVVSGDKKLGIDSFRKWVSGLVDIEDRISKNHAVSFWFKRPETLPALDSRNMSDAAQEVDGRFVTRAGMFSHGRIDEGSALLVPHLEKIAYGQVADFGAGWGYLSAECLLHSKKVEQIDLYEADYEALEAARTNLAAVASDAKRMFYWHDLTSEPVSTIYDTVICNPPFHEGRAADSSLGQAFIAMAAARLKPGGRLLIVANRQLPYEAILKDRFRVVNRLDEAAGFKLFEARK